MGREIYRLVLSKAIQALRTKILSLHAQKNEFLVLAVCVCVHALVKDSFVAHHCVISDEKRSMDDYDPFVAAKNSVEIRELLYSKRAYDLWRMWI